MAAHQAFKIGDRVALANSPEVIGTIAKIMPNTHIAAHDVVIVCMTQRAGQIHLYVQAEDLRSSVKLIYRAICHNRVRFGGIRLRFVGDPRE